MRFWPPEDILKVNSQPFKRAEHSPPLQSQAWPSHCSSSSAGIFISPQFVSTLQCLREQFEILPVTLGLRFLKPEASIFCQKHFWFLPCPWTLFLVEISLRGSRHSCIWLLSNDLGKCLSRWLGENSSRDIFLPWRSSFKGKLAAFFSHHSWKDGVVSWGDFPWVMSECGVTGSERVQKFPNLCPALCFPLSVRTNSGELTATLPRHSASLNIPYFPQRLQLLWADWGSQVQGGDEPKETPVLMKLLC